MVLVALLVPGAEEGDEDEGAGCSESANGVAVAVDDRSEGGACCSCFSDDEDDDDDEGEEAMAAGGRGPLCC